MVGKRKSSVTISAMKTAAWYARILAGALVWIAAGTIAALNLANPPEGRGGTFAELGPYLLHILGKNEAAILQFPYPVEIAVGDPIFHRNPGGALSPVGEVEALLRDGQRLPFSHAYPGHGVHQVECTLRAGHLRNLPGKPRGKLLSIPETFSWVLRTLLPKERIASLTKKWNLALLEQREEIFKTLSPVVSRFVRTVQEVLAADLPPALKDRREELGMIGRRLNEEIVEREFKPLIRTELWPVIERRTKPALQALSSEILKRAPLWGITWRYLYQTLPFTSDSYLKETLEEFWREEAVSILKDHADEFLLIAEDIAQEAAANPRLNEAFRRSFDRLLEDQELQQMLRLIIQEVILDNPRFHESLKELGSSPEVERALQALSPRIEPLIRQVGVEILGTPEAGITPEFASVLRTQILQKDRRWILLECEKTGGDPPKKTPRVPLVIPAVAEGR